ncbi:MAG: tetratricopeptide repeat protein [Prevotella sp.]|nr:tetratricopeptide repeat protein [Prevotella sp.]
MKVLRYIMILMLGLWWSQSALAQADRQFIRNGNKFYKEQNYAKAEIEYRKALSKNPRNTQAMYNLGCALLMQQKDSAATVQLQNAGKSETAKKRKSMAYHNIGVICQKHQMYSEAIEAYKESLRNNPADNETRYNLALCKRLAKNQKQNGGGKNNKNDKNKDKKDKNQDKNKQNSKQDKQQQQQQQPKDQMSKENAEQLLNYAIQEEKATQQRMKQQKQQPQHRRLQKDW